MAGQVPYSGSPEISAQVNPLSQVHEDTPVAAFGGAVAGAISHLGEVAQGAGKELFARAEAFQMLDEQNRVDEAATKTANESTDLYLELSKKHGQEAIDAQPAYREALQKSREDNAEGLSPWGRQQYQRITRSNESRMIWHGGVLGRENMDIATTQAGHNAMAAATRNFVTVDPQDPKALDEYVNTLKTKAAETVHSTRAYGGFAPGTPESDQAVQPMVSKELETMISAKLAGNDAIGGKRWYEALKDKGLFTPEAEERLGQKVQNAVDVKKGTDLGHQVASDPANKGLTPSELKQKLNDAAENLDPGNQRLKTNTEIAGVQRQNLEKSIEQTSWRETQDYLIGRIDGSSTNGKVPLSLDEAREDPRFREKYDQLPETEQRKVAEQILRNNATDGWVHNDIGNREFNNLHSALTDPRATTQDVDDALNADLIKSHMTREQRTTIQNLINTTLKNQSNQANVNSALNIAEVKTAMRGAKLLDADNKPINREAYDKFTTEFTIAIGEYANAAHRTIKDHKQLGEIANAMLLSHVTEHLGGYWNTKSDPLYKNIFEADPARKAQAIKIWQEEHGGDMPTQTELDAMAPQYYKNYFQQLGAMSRQAQPKTTNRATGAKP